MKKRKVLWLLTMAGLCIIIYTIVVSRMDSRTDVIFGGVDGAYVSSDKVNFVNPNAIATPEPTVNIWPDIDINLPQYAIVNNDNLVSSAYEPEVGRIEITKYQQFEVSALPHINEMLADMIEAGFDPYIASSYRTYSYQNELFNSKASQIAYGYGVTDYNDPLYQKAADEARKVTAFPGSSEHQLGLAVDILDKPRSRMVYEEMDQEFFAWLDENCAKYGFIKRHDGSKSLVTGQKDDVGQYRYVGYPHSYIMKEQDLCLEEYIAVISRYTYNGQHYKVTADDGHTYEIYYCPLSGDVTEITVPAQNTVPYTISGDNYGGFIVTVTLN